MSKKGRGWHGESGRHAQAARGIPTVKKLPVPLDLKNIGAVERANDKMDRILKRLDPFAWKLSVRELDKLTNELDDVIKILNSANLPDWMNLELEIAEEELELAWASKERARILTLELARERLHNVIRSYLKFEGKGLPGPPMGYEISAPWEWGN